jgi:hypothetical protein
LGLVEYLIQTRGSGAVTCLLSDLAEGRLLAEALRQETELSPETLVSSWKAWAGI